MFLNVTAMFGVTTIAELLVTDEVVVVVNYDIYRIVAVGFEPDVGCAHIRRNPRCWLCCFQNENFLNLLYFFLSLVGNPFLNSENSVLFGDSTSFGDRI